MRKRTYLSCLVLFVLATAFNACSGSKGDTSLNSKQTLKSDFKNETKTTESAMEIVPGMIENVVTISKLAIQTGSVTMTLTKPKGEVFFTKKYDAMVETSDSIKMNMDIGVWKLKMDYEGATGNILITWNAHN